MSDQTLDQNFWSQRWASEATGWDIGYASTPIREFIDSIQDKQLRILIPGAGNAYEAEYLWNKGFQNITVLDIVQQPLDQLAGRLPEFPRRNLVCADFFTHEGTYDLIIEQTFYCAIDPALRDQYVKKMHSLLASGGRLAGLLFSFPLTQEGPPFGGDESEYRRRFEEYFEIIRLSPAENSIPPRAGRELFIELVKKG